MGESTSSNSTARLFPQLVYFLYFSRMRKQEWVGEQRALRVSGARKPPSAIFPRSALAQRVAGCFRIWWAPRADESPALGTQVLGSSVCPGRVSCCAAHLRRRLFTVHASSFPTVYFALVRMTIL